ncbi:MAG: hypothetical protein R2712_05925 [Vicinamibacterales bacterium]
MRSAVALVVVTVAVMCLPVSAKGITTRIVMTRLSTGQVTVLSEARLLEQFDVWSGPGTSDTSATSFIVDWAAGAMDAPGDPSERLEVRFLVRRSGSRAEELAYVVYYVPGSEATPAAVYLPGRGDEHFTGNVRSILRGPGFEGRWFRASDAWRRAASDALH